MDLWSSYYQQIVKLHRMKTARVRRDDSSCRACVLQFCPPNQRSRKTAVVPWCNTARTDVGQHVGLSEDYNLHPNHQTKYHLRQNHARTQKTKMYCFEQPCSNTEDELRRIVSNNHAKGNNYLHIRPNTDVFVFGLF